VSLLWRPQPLLRVAEPFDHPDWLFELKHDGFRALAHVDRSGCRFVSRNGHVFGQWPVLCDELVQALHRRSAILDGEVVCLRDDGNSDFNALLFRRGRPVFYAFDLLAIGGRDLRSSPLLERKRRLRDVLTVPVPMVRYVDHVDARGADLFAAVSRADAEGIVGKWMLGSYHSDGVTTSWVKVKNAAYSQMAGRHELFADRGGSARRSKPSYRLDRAVTIAW
jgi:bifunctional non-homologous end joining protein LigD